MSRRTVLAAMSICVLSGLQAAQLAQQEISIAFDYSEIDTRKDEHHFRGNVRITQGAMFITSDEATAQGAFQNEDSRWTFENDVHVHTDAADLHADTAVAHIVNGAITNAVVKGSPAVFEQRDASKPEHVRGRAGRIEYDVAKGIVRLTNDVWFNYDGNEFRGAVVVYNVQDERVIVNPEGQNQGRVNITIRPRAGAQPQGGASSEPAEPESAP